MKANRACIVPVLLYYISRTDSAQSIPQDVEWNSGLGKTCPKYPAEQTDCNKDDIRCYDHGDQTYRPCWTICPPPDEDPRGQKCYDWCGDFYKDYCVKPSDKPTTTVPGSLGTHTGKEKSESKRKWPFGAILAAAVPIAALVLGVIFFILWKQNYCNVNKNDGIPPSGTAEPLITAESNGDTASSPIGKQGNAHTTPPTVTPNNNDFAGAVFHGTVNVNHYNYATPGSAPPSIGPNREATAPGSNNENDQQPPGDADGRPERDRGDAQHGNPEHRMADMDTPTVQIKPAPGQQETGVSIQDSNQRLPQQVSGQAP